MMHRSDTATRYANVKYYCYRCGELFRFCECWRFLLEKYAPKPYEKFTKTIMNYKKSPYYAPNIIRRMLSAISGMRGVKLMKRLNKR